MRRRYGGVQPENCCATMSGEQNERTADGRIMSDAERYELLVSWNETRRTYPVDVCIHELFERAVLSYRDAPAAICENSVCTYSELNARANKLAHYLCSIGVRPDDRIALCFQPSLDMLVGILAVLKAGGAFVPLDPNYPRERLSSMLGDCGAGIVLTHSAVSNELVSFLLLSNCVVLDAQRDEPLWEGCPVDNLQRGKVAPKHLAYVLYTSGTTGKPKGVMVEHRNVVNLLAAFHEILPANAHRNVMALTTYTFDPAYLELFLPILYGGCVTLVARAIASDAALVDRAIAAAQPSLVQATPTTWRMLVEYGWSGCDGVVALCGGEALPSDLPAQLSGKVSSLWNVYGPTETTIWSIVCRVQLAGDATQSPRIGRPIGNTKAYVLDKARRLLPIGTIGELYIGGAGVARGYLNRPELTAERFIANPFVPGDRLYATGDLVRYHCDGNLEVLGRNDFQVKIRGFRVELADVEAHLRLHPGVLDAIVLMREDVPGEKRLAAYYRSRSGPVDPADMRRFLASRLPDYMIPSAYVFLSTFPQTSNGKVDRAKFPRPDVSAYATRYEAPLGEKESTIARIWCDVLHLERISRHDEFFQLGGHSLLAMRVVSSMRRAGLRVDAQAIFSSPTVAELARLAKQDVNHIEARKPTENHAELQDGTSRDASKTGTTAAWDDAILFRQLLSRRQTKSSSQV